MKIQLVIDGKKKTFNSKPITFRGYHNMVLYEQKIFNANQVPVEEQEFNFDDYMEFVDIVVDYFGNQFTVDEFLDGYYLEGGFEHSMFVFEVLGNVRNGGAPEPEGKKKDQTKK